MSQYLGVDVFDVSLYMTIVYLTEVVLSAPVGRLLQRFDMRIVCTAAACSTSLGFAAMSFYTELWQWYLSGVLIGFGEITLLWLMVASLLNRWFSKRLGLVIGLSYAMTGVGGAVLNLVGQFLLGADLSGWREVYLVLGLVAFALSVPFTLFAIRSHPEDVGLKAYGAALEPSVAQVDGAGDALPGIPAKQAFRKWYFFALVFAGCMANIGGNLTALHDAAACRRRRPRDAASRRRPHGHASGDVEAFTMAGMAGGKVLIGGAGVAPIQLALVIDASVARPSAESGSAARRQILAGAVRRRYAGSSPDHPFAHHAPAVPHASIFAQAIR